MRISFGTAVHSGSKTALVVKVMTEEGAKDKTPLEGSVNGVQCALVIVDAEVLVGIFQICLASICNIAALPLGIGRLFTEGISTLFVFGGFGSWKTRRMIENDHRSRRSERRRDNSSPEGPLIPADLLAMYRSSFGVRFGLVIAKNEVWESFPLGGSSCPIEEATGVWAGIIPVDLLLWLSSG